MKSEITIGDRFNQFVVIGYINTGQRNRLKVRCNCGRIVIRRLDHLISGRTKSCKNCASKRTAQEYGMPSRAEYIGDLGKTYFSSIRYGALRRSLPFTITQQYLWDLLVDQQFKCALTGLPIKLSTTIKKFNANYSQFTASPDRIDSTKGYIEGNVQWVHRDVNRMKNKFSQEYFISICKLIGGYSEQKKESKGICGI